MKQNNKKIRICFLTFLAYPLFNHDVNSIFGGAEIDLYNMANKLAENDRYEITFVVGDYGQNIEELHNGIRVRKFKYFNLDTFKKVRHKFKRQIVMWKELFNLDADVYITEASSELLGWMALISKKIKGKKIIFRLAHDLDTDFVDTRSKSFKLYYLYKTGIYNSDFIISQTKRQQKMLKENLNLDSTIIKNGFFINENIDFSMKDYILWVARAEEWKRPWLFVELARRMPEEKFVMVMPGKSSTKDRILEEVSQLENLEFIDFVPFYRIQEYYDRAKLFVNTSLYEGFPNAFVQACLGKTPILSFSVNPDNFINENNLGVVCDDSLDRAVDFITELKEGKLEFYGQNAFSYVKRNHDIAKISAIYEDIINSLVKEEVAGEKASI
ncbi:MAG: glycosyltransferase family 4 protein [Bacillota bacterium]